MKKIDKLVLRSFVGPFILTFFITMFVLDMQFLWKYIDDLIGKGLEWYIIMELMFFASASMVPMALPLAVLLSSIMTFGNFGEHYELVALKSSGISLFKVMRPLIGAVFLISIGAYFFSNNVLPKANLKFSSLLYDIRQQKPALNIKQGIFYNGIDGYSIYIGTKDKNNRDISDIMIYDHTSGKGSDNVLVAEDGEMFTTKDGRLLHLILYNGTQYQIERKKIKRDVHFKHLRTSFEEWEKIFDLSSFSMTRTPDNLWKDHYQMLSVDQLEKAMDTLNRSMNSRREMLYKYVRPLYSFKGQQIDSIREDYDASLISIKSYDELRKNQQKKVLKKAKNLARNVKNYSTVVKKDLETKSFYLIRHELEWYRKFTLSTACLVLFFIGAPLGAIIRIGGLGLPLVVSVLFFVLFYVISIAGEKMAKQEVLSTFWGMWLSTLILFPIGFFLTFKAMYDSSLFNLDWYLKLFNRFFKRITGTLEH
ncbi:MAG: LptF/LptG family permease [Bacteroidetes bacterium]|nr:LptF/LptG family permease [Bacteroidota bacterium]